MARKEFRGRCAMVYLPTKEIFDCWAEDAAHFGSTISEYIFEMVEKARNPGDEEIRPDLTLEVGELKNRNRKLEHEIKLLKINLENSQSEIYRLRFGGFSQLDSEEAREYDLALIGLLKRGGVLDSMEILAGLGIDPRDSTAARLVGTQLEELRKFGLVRETPNGWRWI